MLLAEKILNLRKKSGWSQEDLAEKMNVSRQSISKWESARSIPDMNKIILLSEIFGVSTDYLFKDDNEDEGDIVIDKNDLVKRVTLDDALAYIEGKKEASNQTAIGVLFCILSVAPLFILLTLSDYGLLGMSSTMAIALGFITLLGMISIGVVFFIRTNQYNTNFENFEDLPFELDYGVRQIIKEELKSHQPNYLKRVSVAVVLFIMSSAPLITAASIRMPNHIVMTSLVLLFVMIGLGVFIIVPISSVNSAMQLLIEEGDYAPHKKQQMARIKRLGAFYWPFVTAIYIGWSLWTMAWGITWIIWPVSGITFVALIGLIGLLNTRSKTY